MITFRGQEEEQRVAELAKLLGLDKSEVLRRAVNAYYKRYQGEFKAYDWLAPRLSSLPGSGRSDISARHNEALEDAFGQRTRPGR